MAFIEQRSRKDGTLAFRVIWRTAGQRETETFDARVKAENFRGFVEAANDSWPPGWTPGQGWAGDFIPAQPTPSMTSTQFASDSARRRVKASVGTRTGYQLEIDRYVENTALGITPWRAVTAATVSDWLLMLQARGLSAKTIINVHGLLSSSWKEAMKAGDTGVNPFDGLGPVNRVHPEDVAVYLTPQQFETLYDLTPDFYKPLVYCLAATGGRISELLALPAKNVDAVNSLIKIRQSWKKSEVIGQFVLGPPKTPRSRRDISVDEYTLSLLMTAAEGKKPDGFIFTGKRGRRLDYKHFYQNIWLDTVNSLPVTEFPKRPRIHDLRHTHASWLIGSGHNILEVSRRLGHEKVSTTADTYGHLFPTAETGMAADIAGLLGTAITPNKI